MSWLDIFSKGPSPDAIAKQVRKAKEGYGQPDYRRMAMDQLLKWNTDESIKGLLERFCVVVQSPHWDEEEKRWLVEQLVELGAKAEPIVRNFILEKNEVNYALQAYKQIVNDNNIYNELLIEALKHRPPSDHRSVQGKQEIIAAMIEQNNSIFDQHIAPHIEDHSDDVQYLAIEAVSKTEDQNIKNMLINLLKSDEHSARVLRAAALVVKNNHFALPPNFELAEVLSEDYRIENGLLVSR